jgi:hypothetical protein
MDLDWLKGELWRQGDLRYKLWVQQEPIYAAIRALPRHVNEAVALCARQFGKSHLGVTLAVEDCIRFPNRCIMIVGPTYEQTRDIVAPRLELVARDAPTGMVSRLKSEKKWRVGDSELVIGGFDVNSSSQRGKTVQNVYIEEVVDAKPDSFMESMRSDLGPALTHSDAGKMIYLTTLPKIPDHPFIIETLPRADLNGALYVYTIDDNKALTPEQYQACVDRAGGRDSDDFKREYLCLLVRDRNIVVIPDFDEALHVSEVDLPLEYKPGIWIDWGGVRDKTVALLVTHDFYNDMDLYWDEIAWPSNTPTETIVRDLRKQWGADFPGAPYIIDAPGQLLVDLKETHGITSQLPAKGDWKASINQLAVRFAQKKVKIHPRCKLLRQTCRSGTFNDQKTDFSRTESLGHCDAIAAAMYANRGLDRSSPYGIMRPSADTTFIMPKTHDTVQMIDRSFVQGRGLKKFGGYRK